MIPLVAESGRGVGQAESTVERWLEMWCDIMAKLMNRNFLERNALESESLVDQVNMSVHKRVGRLGLDV